MDSAKQLRDLSKVYMEAVYGGGKKEEKKDTRLVVTAADKKANTKAYQNYKAGNKAYKAADHLGEGIKGEDNETRKAAALERKAGVKTRLSPSEGRKNVANMLYKIRNAKSNLKNESVSEDKKYGYDKDGNSLNPVDIEKREKEDDDLAGSPNKNGKKNGKKAKRWWDDDGDGKGYEKGEVDGKFPDKDGSKKKKDVKEAVYGGKKEAPKDNRMVLTHADKKANTPAWQNRDKKNPKTGQSIYKKADHLNKEEVEVDEGYEEKKKGEVLAAMKKQGRKLSDKDKDKIANKVVVSKGDTSKSDDRYAYEELDPGMEHNLSILRMLAEKEVNVKDTKKVVDAIRAYDKSKDASRDATDDSDKGDKEGAAVEKKYAAKERGEIKKDDPNWKNKKYHTGMHGEEVEYDELDNDLLEFAENTLGNFPENEILDMMESMYHRRNPGKKHPLESGSSKVTPRPVSDKEKKSTDKEDRMYVAMRRVKDRQKGYDKDKSDAADRLHGHYTSRQSARKKGASPKEAAAGSHGDFGSKGFRIKRGGRSGEAPRTDRGTGNKAARRAGQEVRDTRKK